MPSLSAKINSVFFLRVRMIFKCSYLVSCLVLSSFLFGVAEACWGKTAPDYGDMTKDYDLLEGADIVLNCTLKARSFDGIPRRISSSDLVFEKQDRDFSNLTRKIDDFTLQLKIPRAKISDSGLYLCKIVASNDTKPVVCGSKVSVGYPPKHVTNFTCIIKNYDSLRCSWNSEPSAVLTKYKITNHGPSFQNFDRKCPDETEMPNSCEWTTETEPLYQPFSRNVSLSVEGNNSLGISIDNFILDGYAIVIPNRPENLTASHVGTQYITVRWTRPKMRSFGSEMPMQFEVWIGRLSYNLSDIQVFDAGTNTSEFIIKDLIPHISYNISIRCKSVFAKNDMWSSLASLIVRTLPDVPYVTPEVITEAYELHHYEDHRTISLYWKDVPKLFHNGEDFHFHIKYFRNVITGPSNISSVNSSVPFVKIKKLLKNSSYSFRIYSVNREGISGDYESFFVDSQDKILDGPKGIRAISQDVGHYNLSWNTPPGSHNVSYIVFWCSSLKPWLSRCDSPVQWINDNLTENSIILNLTDAKTNFQFAVVAKTETSSSGMKWASCIVPRKAALGKIRYVVVDQRNSNSLKVNWNLDCPAQKAVVNRYEIIYCRINRNKVCEVSTVEPNAESYLLQNLSSFSNYSIKIRAFNKDDLPSEDSDAVLQTTLPGAPSGPPQNVQAYSKSNSSIHVSWTTPVEPNGIITNYTVSYNGTKMYLNAISSQKEYNLDVNGLNPFTVYAIQIQACVNDDCSVNSKPVMVRTDVGVPGYMDPPRIELINSTHLKVSWTAPVHPNGPIDRYIVEWYKEDQNETYDSSNRIEVSNILSSVHVNLDCPASIEKDEKFSFYVRAVNIKNGTWLFGPTSESTTATACLLTKGEVVVLIVALVSITLTAVVVGALYFAVKWMRRAIQQAKSITIRLPKGLEGPETNPLNHYEYFKHGLNQSVHQSSIDRLSYVTDENEKNRHGSGSSQFSNSSAEELIFKNGKCTKFGRKPSGDSSGCSSMSSNTTPRIHLSSDSGTESDFAIPPSPDSAITEPSLHSSHKSPLPILMEVYDQQIGEHPSPNKQAYGKNSVDDMILKGHQPYSKFGIAGSTASSVPSRVNPLAFYNSNLANSEPSVFNLQKSDQSSTTVAPYSKVGLAKSSGDILAISPMKQMGYSKFGCPSSQKRFSIPPPNLNPIAMVMMESPNIKKYLGKKIDSNQMNDEQLLNASSQELEEDSGYIKIGVSKLCAKKSSQGYVPFNELKSQLGHIPPGTSMNPDPKDFYHTSSGNKDNEVADDVEWPYNSFDEENKTLMHEDTPSIIFDVPFLQNSVNNSSKDSESFSDFKVPYLENLEASPYKLPFGGDVKHCFDTPAFHQSTENHQLDPTPLSDSPNTNNIQFSNENSVSEEPKSDRVCNGKTNNWYDVRNEVVVTPMTLKNGYVPFSTLSDPVCDRTLHHLPNSPNSNAPLSIFSNGVCTETNNYVTPSNKGELRLLRDDSLSKVDSSNKQKDTKTPNGIGYTSGSLTYILKPLPKMESEICEV